MYCLFSLQPDIIECGQKEIKKVGLINAFFQPIKAKQDAKTRLGIEVPASSNQESSQDLASDVNKANNEVVQEPNTSGSISKKVGPTSKRKTSNLSGKLNHATCTSDQESSHEEPVKPKQLKPKWSVTCAVRNSSKYLNSSGSDFEDDSKGVSNAKTKQRQKSGKKNAKSGSRSNGGIGAQESERNTSESADDKDSKSRAVHKQKSNTTKLVLDQHIEQHTETNKSDNESKASGRSKEKIKQTRTSAFDVLMKSQRVQKLEDQRTEMSLVEAPNTAIISSDSMLEISHSCEIVDDEETLKSKTNVTSQSKLPISMVDSSSDRITGKSSSSSETNAFDFLMKKGRLAKSPTSVDTQLESELDSEVPGNFEGSSKKKSKKKSFEFQLSIRASKKKDIEFSLESDYTSSDVNCEDQSKGKSKQKTRKQKRDGLEVVEGQSDESFVSDKCEEVVGVSKSRRGRKKSKVNADEDKADISLCEVTATEERNKSVKKGRKAKRKSASGTAKDVVANDEAEVKPECVETAQNKRKKEKQQRKDHENIAEIKDKKVRKPTKKRMKSDAACDPPQSLSTESQETSVWYVHNVVEPL